MTGEDPENDGLHPRSSQEVAERCLALLAVIDHAYSEDEPDSDLSPLDPVFRIATTPTERAFLNATDPPEHDRAQFSWRAEALVSLLWALQRCPSVYPLNQQVDLSRLVSVQEILQSPADFLRTAELRSQEELADAEQDLYHQHWRVRDAQLFRKPMPAELNPEIVHERRYGLSWVVGWGEDWDDVPTDT